MPFKEGHVCVYLKWTYITLGSAKAPNPTDDWHKCGFIGFSSLCVCCIIIVRWISGYLHFISNDIAQSKMGKEIMALRSFSASGMPPPLIIIIVTDLKNSLQASDTHGDTSRKVSKCLLSVLYKEHVWDSSSDYLLYLICNTWGRMTSTVPFKQTCKGWVDLFVI